MENFTDRAPINPAVGRHDFVLSEFSPKSGCCDVCGGSADAEIHQEPVDQVARIADALEAILVQQTRMADLMAELAKYLRAPFLGSED